MVAENLVPTGIENLVKIEQISYLGVINYSTYCILSCLVCIVILCVYAVLCVYCFFALDAGLLARSQYSEGPAAGLLDTGFSRFPCV